MSGYRAPSKGRTKFCKGCGEILGAAVKFCANCGEKVSNKVQKGPKTKKPVSNAKRQKKPKSSEQGSFKPKVATGKKFNAKTFKKVGGSTSTPNLAARMAMLENAAGVGLKRSLAAKPKTGNVVSILKKNKQLKKSGSSKPLAGGGKPKWASHEAGSVVKPSKKKKTFPPAVPSSTSKLPKSQLTVTEKLGINRKRLPQQENKTLTVAERMAMLKRAAGNESPTTMLPKVKVERKEPISFLDEGSPSGPRTSYSQDIWDNPPVHSPDTVSFPRTSNSHDIWENPPSRLPTIPFIRSGFDENDEWKQDPDSRESTASSLPPPEVGVLGPPPTTSVLDQITSEERLEEKTFEVASPPPRPPKRNQYGIVSNALVAPRVYTAGRPLNAPKRPKNNKLAARPVSKLRGPIKSTPPVPKYKAPGKTTATNRRAVFSYMSKPSGGRKPEETEKKHPGKVVDGRKLPPPPALPPPNLPGESLNSVFETPPATPPWSSKPAYESKRSSSVPPPVDFGSAALGPPPTCSVLDNPPPTSTVLDQPPPTISILDQRPPRANPRPPPQNNRPKRPPPGYKKVASAGKRPPPRPKGGR